MLLTISLSGLYCILRPERITALRAEFRWILRICRFPSAPAAAILHLLLRFLRSAVHTELAFIHRTTGTGPSCPPPDAMHHTPDRISPKKPHHNCTCSGTSRSPCSVPCRRNRLRCLLLYTLLLRLLLLAHLKQLLRIQTTCISSHTHAHKTSHSPC